ncbi:unnamed protein product [Penicillium salamii]|nr:unnamed protein product [Penicillium salamii]CAG7985496.1 unnamed protein product [Penicillium salamii]CAG8279687.1 unnamed protein product [Penicillium salamii]
MLEGNIVSALTTYAQGSSLSSQQFKIFSGSATAPKTHVPGGEEWRHLTSNILPSAALPFGLTDQRLDKVSSLPSPRSETATNSFVSDWSHTGSTETIKPTTAYAEADNELGSSGPVYQDSQNFSGTFCLNSLVVTNTMESKIGIQSMLQPTGLEFDDIHDSTEGSGVVFYPDKSYNLPVASLLITPTSNWVSESTYAHAPSAYSSQATSQGIQAGEPQAKAKNFGIYVTRNPNISSNCVRLSHGPMCSQTVQERPEASDGGLRKPPPITITSFPHPKSMEPDTTTTTDSIVEKPTMDKTQASRTAPAHVLGLVLGCIFGVSLVFAVIFFSHRFCFRRALRPRRNTDSTPLPKVDSTSAKYLRVSESMEVSRFSAYS